MCTLIAVCLSCSDNLNIITIQCFFMTVAMRRALMQFYQFNNYDIAGKQHNLSILLTNIESILYINNQCCIETNIPLCLV